MELSRNNFKLFLVNEVTRQTRASVSSALKEVNEFSNAIDFDEYYKKWVYLNKIKIKKTKKIKSVKEIISNMNF